MFYYTLAIEGSVRYAHIKVDFSPYYRQTVGLSTQIWELSTQQENLVLKNCREESASVFGE